MKTINLILLIFTLSTTIFADELPPIAKKVEEVKLKTKNNFRIFDNILTTNSSNHLQDTKSNTYFDYNKMLVKDLLENTNEFIALKIPFKKEFDENSILDLIKVPESFNNYTLTLSSLLKPAERTTKMKHFRGVVRGRESESIVALSISENQMMGIISIEGEGTFNIGKSAKEGTHVINNDTNFKTSDDHFCYTSSDSQNPILNDIYSNVLISSADNSAGCLSIYIEVDHDIYTHFNSSISNTKNFVTGIFNQVATLYMNESITLEISEIFVWNTPDNYNPGISVGLNEFVTKRTSFNGDLAHFLSFRNESSNTISNAGGRANGIGGLCVTGNSNLSPHSHTALFPDFNTFPNFSRQVKVITHEIGHNLGSRHTHACVWNQNNTAIDNCAGFTEGNCPIPLAPVNNGGTIMSYCDRTVGIDFSLGFGTQPGNVIRSFVNQASCIESCAPTCNDGIQNGNEEGIDCGGSCPNACEPENCLTFDGIDDYIKISSAPSKAIGTNDFTFEAWIEGEENEQTQHPIIFSNRKPSNAGGFKFFFHGLWGGSNYKMLSVQLNWKNYLIVNNGSYNGSLLDGNCHHVAITLKGNTLSFYADGELFGTRTITGNPSLNSNVPLWIGSEQYTSNRFKGIISQVRMWKTVRTAAQIKDNMNVSLSGNTTDLVSYWEINEGSGQTIIDKTGLANGVVGQNVGINNTDPQWLSCSLPCFNQVEPPLENCLTFDGIDDYIKISSAPSKAIGTNDFTFEAWVEGNENEQTQHPIIFSNRKPSNAGGFKFFFHDQWGGSNYKMLSVQLDWKNYLIVNNGSYNGSLLDGNCHHVAITLEGSTLSFYADGELFGTRTITGNPSLRSNVPLWIGSEQYTSNRFKGTISQVRMWKTARTSAQIKDNLNVSLSGNTTDLVSYWEINEGSGQTVIDKTGLANGVVGQNAGINNTDPQWLSCSSYCFNQVDPKLGDFAVDNLANSIIILEQNTPNPAKEFTTISYTITNEKAKATSLKIYNIAGKLVKQFELNKSKTNTITVPLKNMESGLYFYTIATNNGTSVTKKMMVKH